jgi:hypothetical protein
MAMKPKMPPKMAPKPKAKPMNPKPGKPGFSKKGS